MSLLKLLFLSCLLSFAFVLISGHDSHTFSLPFFFWSEEPQPRFKNGMAEHLTTVGAEDVEGFLEELVNGVKEDGSRLTNYLNLENHDQASSVFLFVVPQMRTDLFSSLSDAYGKADGGCFKNLKSVVENAPSSLVLPYVRLDEPFSVTLESTLADSQVKIVLPSTGRFELHSLYKRFGSKAEYMTHEDLLDELNNANTPTSSRRVFVIGFEENLPSSDLKTFFTPQDEFIGKVHTLLKKTESKYIGIFGAERSLTQGWRMETERTTNVEDYISFKYLEAIDETENQNNKQKKGLYDNHWPPAVWEGLMVSLVLILIALIGISCACQIQVPKMFTSPSSALSKKKD